MNAQEITIALGGTWRGSSGMVRCPSHEDKSPSLSVRDGNDGGLLTHCFSGCPPEAVWGALQDRCLVEQRSDRRAQRRPRRRQQRPGKQIPEPSPNQDRAITIWRVAQPATGTLAEDYPRGCGITIPVPPTIRFHPALKHPDIGQYLPALVAAACNVDRKITGIQRIYLTYDGRKAPLSNPRMALGTLTGSAVRLAPTVDKVWLTEGIEDGLALMQMMREPAWALLGTGNFKNVELPDNIRTVVLAPDNDEAGQGIIQESAIRLAGQGREVRAAKLPPGRDWVDVLDDYEERAGILEFDFEEFRPDAEAVARRDVLDG